MRALLNALTRNSWSRFGSALTTASALVFLVLLALDLGGRVHGPYHGMVAYLLIPALFVLGLLLIPIGIVLDRRRARRAGADAALPVVDLNVRRTRAMVLGFLGLTGINVALLGIATYRGAEAMETTKFCGTTCHNIMTPEYTTHAASAHSGVRCVHCHIGPGGTFYVRAKLNGAKQAVEAVLDRYPRPIPAPVHILRPAHEICTECHEAAKDKGEVRRVIRHRGDDEKNTAQETVFMMHVGGRGGDRAAGIHWHADPATKIR
ncbi:MAG TPA: NapC/NirT family cytochrome c, partial [Candidatus Polarisedimenticolia bacterium]|nr:NapC/NirT family cytochrome c [Candidatus Polarisedimenticolia bacterium]